MNEQAPIAGEGEQLAQILELQSEKTWFQSNWVLASIALIVLAIGAAAGYYFFGPKSETYIAQKIEKRDLIITVSATGALQPVNQVDVGVEISGTLEDVLVDFNDRVKAGDVLARIDTEQLEALRRQSAANLAQANAGLAEARASAGEAKARLNRQRQLTQRGFVSTQGLETAEATYERAKAAVTSAKAQIALAEAALEANDTNLEKAIVRAPIDGIILKRAVEPGQTVAASFQTPILFTLAQDLTRMELHVDIDEADIGLVNTGQKADFSVDAYPGRTFEAEIISVHNAPQTVQGVVTYEAVLNLKNDDLALKPGMTATADILVEQLSGVLGVPNAALRFAPKDMEAVPPKPLADGSGNWSAQVFIAPGELTPQETSDDTSIQTSIFSGVPEATEIIIGRSDGSYSAIISGGVGEGDQVVTDIEHQEE